MEKPLEFREPFQLLHHETGGARHVLRQALVLRAPVAVHDVLAAHRPGQVLGAGGRGRDAQVLHH